jgi:HK97 gp10 family phage protein
MKEFNGFGLFAAHLMRTAAIGEEVSHHITEEAAEIIRDDAKVRLGIYQDHIGPFNEWAPLADSTVADRVNKGYRPNDPLVREGDLRDSIEVTQKGREAVVGSASDIALYQEQGTEHIPPRPFLGPAGFASKRRIAALATNTVVAWIAGKGWHRPAQLVRLP